MRPNLLVPLELVFLVAMSLWIVLELRPPLATLVWILVVAALPIGGAGIFFLLGPRRVRRSRSLRQVEQIRLRALAPSTKDEDSAASPLPQRLEQLALLGTRAGGAAPTTGNRVRVLRDGTQCFPALESAIASARHHVHLEYYIFRTDQTGTRLRDLLVERARAGVQVRLLVDAFGSGLSRQFVRPLREAGAEVEPFNRMRLGKLAAPGANFRSHRKIVIVDGDTALTGGLNVGDAYAGRDPKKPVRDTHVLIEGPAARSLQLIFLEDWYIATNRALDDVGLMGSGSRPGDERVQIVASGADHRWHAIEQMFFAAINSAEERVRISTPYFVPDQALRMALVAAALRGVSVEVLVPRRSDSRVVSAAGRSFYDELLSAGVRIFEYLPGFLHAKTMVVDGCLATVGSANVNRRSFNTDFEVNAIFYGSALAAELDAMFVADRARARECTLADRSAISFGERLAEAGAHLLAPIL
jgi:cardiolipin synthase